MENLKYVPQVVLQVLAINVLKATKFVSPKLVVRATRTKTSFGRGRNVEITLTIGKPNWAEREFIKLCKKAKEPFPVKRIQLKLIPKKK